MENGSELGVTTAETITIEVTAHRQECKRRAGVTTRASSSETRTTGNWKVRPNKAIINRINLK
jgi:hypothetical protein